MRIELADDGSAWVRVTVYELVGHHKSDEALYRVDEGFQWGPKNDKLELVATAEDFFGETELDFAEEYLLLHGKDEIAYPWEPLNP